MRLSFYWPAIAALWVLCLATGGLSQEESSGQKSLPDTAAGKFRWRSIGPANMGGRITSLAVVEKDSNIWWAASASGGLLKTTNNGITFEHQFDQEATVSIGDVQVSQSNPDIVWVGTGEANPRNSVSWGDGVYKSTDGGKTWKNMGLSRIFQTGRIAIHPTDPEIVYVGALGRLWGPNEDRGLYKTTDGGETWEKILYIDEVTGVIDVQINRDDPDTLLVATYERKRDGFDGNDPQKKFGPGAGIYRTTDGGKSFAKITKGLPAVPMGRIGLSIYRQDPKHVYAIVESEQIGKMPEGFPFVGISGESADVGARITAVTKDSGAQQAGVQKGDIVIAADGQRVLNFTDLQKAIRRHTAGDQTKWEVVRDGQPQLLEITLGSRDEPNESEGEQPGRSRNDRRSPFSARLGGQAANLQGQQGADEANYGGVYHSEDGGLSWKRINTVNPRPMYYSQIRVDPSDNQNLYVLGTSLYRSQDGGEKFTGDGARGNVHVDHHALWIDPADGRHMILGNDGGLYVTYDRMKNWDHHNHVAIAQFYHVGVSANEDYYVYGGLQDNGSWGGPTRVRDASGPMNSDWFRVGGGDGFICLVDPTDPNQIYFESQNGSMGRIHLKSGERGFIRPRAPRGTRYRFNWKTPFLLSPHNPEIHYSAGNHVFRSVRKGDNVKVISPDVTNTDRGAGSAITESPREEGVLYIGTTDGALWMTKDGGKNWSNLFKPPDDASDQRQQEASEQPKDADGKRTADESVSAEATSKQAAEPDSQPTQDSPEPPMKERPPSPKRPRDPPNNKPDETEIEAVSDEAADADLTEQRPGEAAAEHAKGSEETVSQANAKKDPVTGTWKGKFVSDQLPPSQSELTLVLRLGDNNRLQGFFESQRSSGDVSEGQYDPKENKVSFITRTDRSSLEFTGTISGTAMSGTIVIAAGNLTLHFEVQRTGDATDPDKKQEPSDGSQPIGELVEGPRWVSSLSASKFVGGRCYLTLDGHRSNDDLPYLFVTENYGETWRSIRANLPTSAGSTRVLREDIQNPDVLYLGCEFSIWVSIDRGESWTRIGSNMPTVAVHEIAQHPTRGEIVAGTHGRSIWIMDATALRQLSIDSLAEDATLYQPNKVIRWRSLPRRGSTGTRAFSGENPPRGASIYYSLGKKAQRVKVTISDLLGEELYEVAGETTAGLQVITWNLSPQNSGQQRRSSTVPTGDYLVTLRVDGVTSQQVLSVVADPDYPQRATAVEEEALLEALLGFGDDGLGALEPVLD